MMRPAAVVLLAGLAQAGFVKGPYLQNLADSSIVVRWETQAAQDGKVIYGLSSAYEREVVQPDSTIDHELVLTGLVPDTVYLYRAISGLDTSAAGSFQSRVGPETRFRFIVCGDPHGDSLTNQRVADRMAQVSPQPVLVASTGDLTGSGRYAAWRVFFNNWRALLCRAPLFSAPGNHDFDSIPNWFRFLCQPGNELYFSFQDGPASFHCLNAYDSLVPGSSQYEWFLEELRRDSADPGIRHIFVLVHTPPFSTNTVYAGNSVIRDHLCPLFERFRVKVVFSGHVHAYEHSLVNGVHYITTGGGGATLATSWNSAQPWTVYRQAVYQFVLVDVSGDTVFCRGVRTDGAEFDTLVLGPGVGAAEAGAAGNRTGIVRAGCHHGVLRFELEMPERAEVWLAVYDPAGRRIDAWPCWPGRERARLERSLPGLPAGAYFLRAVVKGRFLAGAGFFAVR